MKLFLEGLYSFIITIGKLILVILTFIILLYSLTFGFALLNKQYYEPNNIPDNRFDMLILNEKGEQQPIHWEKLSQIPTKNYQFVTQIDEHCVKYCLRKNDEGNFVYFNDGGGWQSQSEYRVVNGKVVPVSFFMLHVGHMVVAFFFSFLAFAILQYGFLRFWHRHQTQKIDELNQSIKRTLKGYCIFIGLMMGLYGLMYFINLVRH